MEIVINTKIGEKVSEKTRLDVSNMMLRFLNRENAGLKEEILELKKEIMKLERSLESTEHNMEYGPYIRCVECLVYYRTDPNENFIECGDCRVKLTDLCNDCCGEKLDEKNLTCDCYDNCEYYCDECMPKDVCSKCNKFTDKD